MIETVNGIRLHYEVSGKGRHLILLHGNGEDLHIFDEAVQVLQQFYTCWQIDSRCHGESEKTAELHYRDMADDVLAFMEAHDMHDAAVLGFSDGGIIALIAAAATDRITSVIAAGANMTPDGVVLKLGLMIQLVSLFKKDMYLELMRKEPDLTAQELGRIKADVLLTVGQHDLIRLKHTRQMQALIPNCSLKVLPSEDHGSYIVHTSKIAGIVTGFLMRRQISVSKETRLC